MKYQIVTSIHIQAHSSLIWDVLTDFKNYPKWNPYIKSIKGKVEVGEKFQVQMDTMSFRPVALVYDKNKEFTWLGKLVFSGVFDGRHSFFLKEHEDGTTTLHQNESFEGLLVRLMKKRLETDIIKKFNQMNEKLKELAESKR